MRVIIDRSVKNMNIEEIKKEIRHTMAVHEIVPIDPYTGKPWIIEHINYKNLMILLRRIRELRERNFKGNFELTLFNEHMPGDQNNYHYLKFREHYY